MKRNIQEKPSKDKVKSYKREGSYGEKRTFYRSRIQGYFCQRVSACEQVNLIAY